FDQQDRGRCPQDRGRGGLPRQAPDRARSRARARHAAGVCTIPGARSGRGAARRQRCGPAAAVTQPEPNSMKILAAFLALIAGLASAPTQAQDYPSRPIRALTTTSAGGISDIFMRAVGDEMLKRWGQPLVVENRPGGMQNLGARACTEAPPDGYTICILNAEPVAYNQFLVKNMPFDPEKGL